MSDNLETITYVEYLANVTIFRTKRSRNSREKTYWVEGNPNLGIGYQVIITQVRKNAGIYKGKEEILKIPHVTEMDIFNEKNTQIAKYRGIEVGTLN